MQLYALPVLVLSGATGRYQLPQDRKNIMKDIFFGLVIYIGSVAAVGLLWQRPGILFLTCIGITGITLIRWHTRADLAVYLVAALLGTLADLLAVSRGAWAYGTAEKSVPSWLPLVWGIAGLLIKRISKGLARAR